ncbi:hypothetical protein GGF50DRAFT_116356 [Schizophyllum commune]
MLKISTNGVHVLAQSHFPSSQHAPPVFHARRKISPIYLRTADKDIFEACICPTGRGRYGAVALFMIEVAYFCRVPEHFPSLDDNEIRLPKLGICYAKRDWKTSILSAHRCQQTRYGDLSSIIQAILGHCLSPQTSPAARKIAGQSNVRPAPDLRQLLRVSAASISSESRTSRSLPTPTTIHLAQAVEDHFPRLSQYAPSFDPAVYEPEADIPSLARNVTLAQSRVIMRLTHPFPSNAGVRSLFDAVHLVQDDLDTRRRVNERQGVDLTSRTTPGDSLHASARIPGAYSLRLGEYLEPGSGPAWMSFKRDETPSLVVLVRHPWREDGVAGLGQ